MKELNQENFEASTSTGNQPVAVMVKASWCSNCKAMQPVVEKLASEMNDSANFFYLTVDDNEELARSLKIMGVPTLLFYRYGILLDKKLGIKSSKSIKEIIDKMASFSVEDAQNNEYRSLFRRLFGRK